MDSVRNLRSGALSASSSTGMGVFDNEVSTLIYCPIFYSFWNDFEAPLKTDEVHPTGLRFILRNKQHARD
jgi:hypothetical protein